LFFVLISSCHIKLLIAAVVTLVWAWELGRCLLYYLETCKLRNVQCNLETVTRERNEEGLQREPENI
jgi:hypothetical protein